jgi:hypothetical protein
MFRMNPRLTTLTDPILARVKVVPWVAPGWFRDTSAEGST